MRVKMCVVGLLKIKCVAIVGISHLYILLKCILLMYHF